MKIKLDPADKWFAKYVKTRDDYTCQRCFQQYKPNSRGLHCSHFWSRRHEATRFDLTNADTLCFGCHNLWESDKQGEYRDFKIKQLGKAEYNKLEIRHSIYEKKDRKLQAIFWKKAYEDLICGK